MPFWMFMLIVIGSICLFIMTILNYMSFIERNNGFRVGKSPDIETKKDYILCIFVPGYFLWLVFKKNLNKYSDY
jgi:hypothetical protein